MNAVDLVLQLAGQPGELALLALLWWEVHQLKRNSATIERRLVLVEAAQSKQGTEIDQLRRARGQRGNSL